MAASKERKAFQYTPYYGRSGWGKVPPKIGFKLNVHLITKKNYDEVLAKFKSADYTSMDTETTSLKWDDCMLTQINLGLPDNENYVGFYYTGYFPGKEDLLPTPEQLDELTKTALHAPRCYTWNRYFDQRVLMHQRGFDRHDFHHCIDGMDLLWLLDTNVKQGLGLKQSAKDFLGVEPPHFTDALGVDAEEEYTGEAILTADWHKLVEYGGYDAYDTIELGQRLYLCFRKNYPFLLKLHLAFKNALYPIEEQVVPIDQSFLESLESECLTKIENIKTVFYEKYGEINLGSAKAKSDLLMRLGYSTGVWNKPAKDGTPIMSTKAEYLQELVDKQDCEPAKLMINYTKMVKFYGSYVKVMLDFLREGNTPRFHYLDTRVPTLRMAAGKYYIKRKPYLYFTPINIMAVSKPKTICRWLHFDEETLDIEFHDTEQPGDIYVETGDPKLNWRRCIANGSDYMVVKADMCLTLDSLIHTSEGFIPLRDLLGKEFNVMTPWGYKRAYNVRKTGVHPKYRFHLESGKVLECSPEHRIAVERNGHLSWVMAKNVQLMDNVIEYDEQNVVGSKDCSLNYSELLKD